MLTQIKADIQKLANPEKALFAQRFFKTGPGEYAEGDVFLGLTVPQCRKIAQKYTTLPLTAVETLLHSDFHEERLIALLMLVARFKKGTKEIQKEIYDLYLRSTQYINNWDLVDSSATSIVGAYLADKNTKILQQLANSDNLWERRIAIMATFYFIIHQKSEHETFKIAEILLQDSHDLIHKAVGWMLREVGKRISRDTEEVFLQKQYKIMPRTMLRYSLEHFPDDLKAFYMKK